MYRIIQTLISYSDGMKSSSEVVETNDIESYRKELLTEPDVLNIRFTYEEII